MKATLALSFLFAATAAAQFGGRTHDVVLIAITSKGNMDFQVVPHGTSNPSPLLSRLEVVDAGQVPAVEIGGDFQAFSVQILHLEQDDVFQVLTQKEAPIIPPLVFLTSLKAFIMEGIRREFGYVGEETRDLTANAFTTFREGADLGPSQAYGPVKVLLWTSRPGAQFPPFQLTRPNEPGPAVPPGKTGTEYLVELAKFPALIPWTPLRQRHAGGWPDGIDLKFIERDPELGSTIQLLRLRPGRRTPPFRINGNTHLYLLEGRLEMEVPGRVPQLLPANRYVFVPSGLALSLHNPRAYDGPQPASRVN